ncbi:MAG TPA: exopolysaccharide biosynthesis protein [Woeseiaceae bacterium]|nr:exopolysaccharide biosynthesis protein [Woeseiaceae bacterium]
MDPEREDRQRRREGAGRGSYGEDRDSCGPEVGSLGELLDCLEGISDADEHVSVGRVADALGRRSFSPLLLVAGLVMLAPVIGDIPGVPVVMGLLTIVVAVQLILAREHLWLPDWLEQRSVRHEKVTKAVRGSRWMAEQLDRWTGPRLQWLIRGTGLRLVSLACLLVAATTPVLEFIPFSANIAGFALTCFAVALLARDGLLALLALLGCGAVALLLAQQFL